LALACTRGSPVPPAPAPSSSRGSDAAAVASASSSADAAALEGGADVTAARRVFTRVVEGARAPQIFPAGDRAPIAEGAGFWGYARAGAEPVHDPAFLRGLPTAGPNHVEHLGGRWPDLSLSHGSKEYSHYAGPDPQIFVSRGGPLVASSIVPPEVPRGVVFAKGAAYAFVPDPQHFIAGRGCIPHDPPAPQPLLVLRGDGGSSAPRARGSFFLQAIAVDSAGAGWAVGADACVPGAFLAPLGGATLDLERVPGSEACTDRLLGEGAPFTHAYAFPAASGLHVLLVDVAWLGDSDTRAGPSCRAAPRILARSLRGEWSAPRSLPANVGDVAWVDQAGTAWAITPRKTVMRIPVEGATEELTGDPPCDAATAPLVVPFPDQPWMTFRTPSGGGGLCVARLDGRASSEPSSRGSSGR
jgi:hypothetical protein